MSEPLTTSTTRIGLKNTLLHLHSKLELDLTSNGLSLSTMLEKELPHRHPRVWKMLTNLITHFRLCCNWVFDHTETKDIRPQVLKRRMNLSQNISLQNVLNHFRLLGLMLPREQTSAHWEEEKLVQSLSKRYDCACKTIVLVLCKKTRKNIS